MADEDDEAVRLTAYFLWEQDGRPEGRQDEYWQRAREKHARQRDCDGMLEQNGPDDAEADDLAARGEKPHGARSVRREDIEIDLDLRHHGPAGTGRQG